jgi:hypothetical protein
MSDLEVLAALDRLQPLLEAPLEVRNGPAIAAWEAAFRICTASAERGPRWPEVLDRARCLRRLLDRRRALLRLRQQEARRELSRVSAGRRALAAYHSRPR